MKMSGLSLREKRILADYYVVERDTMIELLDDIQLFKDNMKAYTEEFGEKFIYEIEIGKMDKKVFARLKMIENR